MVEIIVALITLSDVVLTLGGNIYLNRQNVKKKDQINICHMN